MPKWLNKIWNDPVGSKVIAGIILVGITVMWARIHLGSWSGLLQSYPIPLWALLLVIGAALFAMTLLLGNFLKRRQAVNEPGAPTITKTDVTIPQQSPPEKGLDYPLKCYVQMRNDSTNSADVRISEFKPGTVTLKKFVVDVLQDKAAGVGTKQPWR